MKHIVTSKKKATKPEDASCGNLVAQWNETALELANRIRLKYPAVSLAGIVGMFAVLEVPEDIPVQTFEQEFDCVVYRKVVATENSGQYPQPRVPYELKPTQYKPDPVIKR